MVRTIEEVVVKAGEPIEMAPGDEVLRTRIEPGQQDPDRYHLTILRYYPVGETPVGAW